jgi:hypothetical protein
LDEPGESQLGGFKSLIAPKVMRGRSNCEATATASAKGEGYQAGAQQHEARRGQRQKSPGNRILVAHDAPATLDAGPN